MSGLAIAVLGGVMFTTTMQVSAKPEFAAQTRLPCGQCHSNPSGSGPLKPFGQKFKDNGFKIK
jgi:hypothetical protein